MTPDRLIFGLGIILSTTLSAVWPLIVRKKND